LVNDQQTRTESKTGLVEQINICLRSGNYSRALDLLRSPDAEFSNDAELSRLEKFAHDGVKRNAEAQRLITESQELFAQQRPVEAIQLLRKAYELDKNNALSRAILANALVEHAHSLVETDWLQAETLTNQALAVNPAHPTARTILSVIVNKKETSAAEDWVSQASKLQSSGDLFAALAWVAEGLAVHPNDPKLLQVQDAIQRDQSARRRQTRRRDLEDLRRIELEIDAAANVVAKQALGTRIQGVAAKYWADGEFLSVANGLLQRLGLAPPASSTEGSTASARSKGAAVIFHVPRPSPPQASTVPTSQILAGEISSNQNSSHESLHSSVGAAELPADQTATAVVSKAPGRTTPSPLNDVRQEGAPQAKIQASSPEQHSPLQGPIALAVEASASAAPIASLFSETKLSKTKLSQTKSPTRPNSTLIFISATATIVVAATFFFTRRHYEPPVVNTAAAPVVAEPVFSAPVGSSLDPSLPASSDAATRDAGTRKVELAARPLTSSGPVVPMAKNGFQDPSQRDRSKQEIHISKGEQPTLVPTLQSQPQSRSASLIIQGGVPGTTVLVDQTSVGTIASDGALSVSAVSPGDHTVEFRKERFKPRLFKEHFVMGGAVSFASAEAALEAASGELKINFAPPDAKVAVVNGEHLTMVSSGIPLNLAAGTYTLTARTADGFRTSSTLEVVAGQSKTLDLSLAPEGMSNWDNPGDWKSEKEKPEKGLFIRKGGNFVLYGVVPASGTFAFSAMPAKGHLLQWVLNYTDSQNYVLCQMDDNNFHRTVIHNGLKREEIIVPDKGERKSFRTLHIRVSSTEIVHQIRHGDSWIVLDRWTQPGANLSLGKFGFYIPGDDEVSLSGFAHYADLNIR
jgi:tetratricopeptide (TPR) repeat protein